MNNPVFQNTIDNARLPSMNAGFRTNTEVKNHWQEEKNLALKNSGFVGQKYKNDPKIMSCLATIRSKLGEYTFSENSMIKEIIDADFDIVRAINHLLGERIMQKNRGKRRMPVRRLPNGDERFIRDDLCDLPDQQTLNQIYDNSLYQIPNIIHPLDDCASHVQDYVQNNMQFYQSGLLLFASFSFLNFLTLLFFYNSQVGLGVRQKKTKDKTRDKDPEKKKKKASD